jgi:uncharacterized protein YxeA
MKSWIRFITMLMLTINMNLFLYKNMNEVDQNNVHA